MTPRAVDSSRIEAPSSEKPTAPASAMLARSAGSSPDRPIVAAPITRTRQAPSADDRVGDRRGRVERRFRVRHRADRRESTPCRGSSGACDRLGRLAAWLAEVGVEVAQAGRQHEPAAVDPLGSRIGFQRNEAIDDGQVPDLDRSGAAGSMTRAPTTVKAAGGSARLPKVSWLMRLRRRGPGRPSARERRSRPGGRSGSAARSPARR